jgi:hypothetical protein
MSIKIIKLIFLVFSLFLGSCTYKKQNVKDETVIETKEEKLQSRFVNKTLESINLILFNGEEINKKKIILIYSGYDCQSCVDKGFLILKTLLSQNENHKVFIISSNTNIGRDQERNNYYDFVYNDEKDLLRQELKFIYTPVLLILDKDNRIMDVYFPETNSCEQMIVEKINKIIALDQ